VAGRRPIRRLISGALVSVLLVVAGACNEDHRRRTASPSTGNATTTVELKNLTFDPDTTEVEAGQSVAWNWGEGTIIHDVAFDDGATSPKQASGTWERAFLDAGSYDYVCTLHPQMTGKVIVS
jgi:plastocyanin